MAKSFKLNLDQFNREVEDFAKRVVPQRISEFYRKIVLEALKRVVMKTPVDTGRARGNWQVSIDAPIDEAVERLDSGGEATIIDGMAVATAAAVQRIPGITYISNNLPYIVRLEYGWSDQAPKGMVRTTINELKTMFP
jgi:hypothetical protein